MEESDVFPTENAEELEKRVRVAHSLLSDNGFTVGIVESDHVDTHGDTYFAIEDSCVRILGELAKTGNLYLCADLGVPGFSLTVEHPSKDEPLFSRKYAEDALLKIPGGLLDAGGLCKDKELLEVQRRYAILEEEEDA